MVTNIGDDLTPIVGEKEFMVWRLVKATTAWPLIALALAMAPSAVEPAAAQEASPSHPVPPAYIPFPGGVPPLPAPPDMPPVAPQAGSGLPADATSFAPSDQLLRPPSLTPPPAAVNGRLVLTARLTGDGPPIRTGLLWRVFPEDAHADGGRGMVAEAKGGSASFSLKPGVYYVYCGFGHSGATDRVEIGAGLGKEQTVVLNAGGLRLNAVARKERPLPTADLSFDIFSHEVDSRGEPKPVALGVHPGEIVRLTTATYNVVANYGSANATTSADVEVKAGKLTDVTLTEKAAKVTLKLVSAPGGEAIADTAWSVLTQAGDLVTTGVGAFPSFVLAEGDYTIVARHGDDQYQRVVTITTGNDADVEVLTTTDRIVE